MWVRRPLRSCAGIRYPTKSMPKHERRRAKAIRIRARLGGEPRLEAAFPAKPAGMHHTTYRRLLEQAADAEAEYQKHLVETKTQYLEWLLNRTRTRFGLEPVSYPTHIWQRAFPNIYPDGFKYGEEPPPT
jgi:hypothetical protein